MRDQLKNNVVNEIFKVVNTVLIDGILNTVIIPFINSMKSSILTIILTFIFNLVALVNLPIDIYNLITQDLVQITLILLEVLGGNPVYMIILLFMPGIIVLYIQINIILATVKIPFRMVQQFFINNLNYTLENTYNKEFITLTDAIQVVFVLLAIIYFGCFYGFLLILF